MLDAARDRAVFQTRAWLEFLERTQGAEPVVADVLRDGRRVGTFTGAIVRRAGVKILGSPFPGWTTTSMGFNLTLGTSRWSAAAALPRFAFRGLGCLHVELKDRGLTGPVPPWVRFSPEPFPTLEVDLTGGETAMFGRMTSACRRALRKSERCGVVVEEASGEAFADEFHEQLREVFARQGLVPTYDVDRVRELIRCLEPTGHLLLVRARSEAGDPLATGIFLGMGRTAWFWGGASHQEGLPLRPNEAVMWFALRHWAARGARWMDLGGGGDHKRKYGPRVLDVPILRRSRLPGLLHARDLAAHLHTRSLG